MIELAKGNRVGILISLIGGETSSFLFAVNLPVFWTFGRISKLLFVFLGAIILSTIVFGLISLAKYFKKGNLVKVNFVHYFTAILFSMIVLIILGMNYSSRVPSKWIFGIGTELETAKLILSGTILFPLISFCFTNSIQRYLWISTRKFVEFKLSKHYQGIFVGFLVIFMISLGFSSINPELISGNFSLSNTFLRVYTWVKYQIGDELYSNSIRSVSNWLLFADSESITDFQNTWPFSDDELQLIERNVTHLNKFLENKGIKLYFIFPPNKNTIYPEYMPEEIPVIGEESRMDQVVEIFQNHPEINYVDLETIYLREKKINQLYYATDSHWNGWGMYVAYVALTELIHQDISEIQPYPYENFTHASGVLSTGDLSKLAMLNIQEEIYQLIPENWSVLNSSENGNVRRFHEISSTSPRLLMFHDSFGLNLIFLLVDHFSYSSFVMGWEIDPLIIEAEAPDVVIIEMTERKLFYLLSLPDIWQD